MKIWTKWRSSLGVALVFLTVTLALFSVYAARTLEGKINNHILPSAMFGVPAELKARGLDTIYSPKEMGWDGQFYYYMSNDLLARKDTPKHIDSPPYRYQRIGLSLYAAIVAKLTGRDWVSPGSFFVSYLLLMFAATYAGAQLFKRFGAHPALILLWSFSVGTQVTLFNALPDGAADAFLILGLAALFSGRLGWSILPFTFAALSREVYAVFPSAVLLFWFLSGLRGAGGGVAGAIRQAFTQLFAQRAYLLLLPGMAAVAWQIYVVRHFGMSPSDQAYGVLSLPLVGWWQSFKVSLSPTGAFMDTLPVSFEFFGLILFLLVLIAALRIVVAVFRMEPSELRPQLQGIAAATLLFALLYTCFGLTVTGHYTGYFKAVAVFFFLIPLMIVLTGTKGKLRTALYALLLVALVVTTAQNLRSRVFAFQGHYDRYTRMSTVSTEANDACFIKFEANIAVKRVTMIKAKPWTTLFGQPDHMVVNVTLTNSSQYPFTSAFGQGGVFMSSQWVNSGGNVVVDGIRTALPQTLLPGHSVNVDVITPIPRGPGLTLRLSPVQEGCAWFFQANPAIAADIPFVTGK